MTDFLQRLADSALGAAPAVEPLIRPRYAPGAMVEVPVEVEADEPSARVPHRRVDGVESHATAASSDADERGSPPPPAAVSQSRRTAAPPAPRRVAEPEPEPRAEEPAAQPPNPRIDDRTTPAVVPANVGGEANVVAQAPAAAAPEPAGRLSPPRARPPVSADATTATRPPLVARAETPTPALAPAPRPPATPTPRVPRTPVPTMTAAPAGPPPEDVVVDPRPPAATAPDAPVVEPPQAETDAHESAPPSVAARVEAVVRDEPRRSAAARGASPRDHGPPEPVTRRVAAADPPDASVHVTIGRIEVHGPAPSPTEPPAQGWTPPFMSLDEYLDGR